MSTTFEPSAPDNCVSNPAMPVPPGTADLILRSPDSVMAALPYLLGFTPEESLVLLWVHGSRLALVERVDLPVTHVPPFSPGDDGTTISDITQWLTAVWSPLDQVTADEVIAVFITDRVDRRHLADHFSADAGERDVVVRDILWGVGMQWGSLLCDSDECCPADGQPINPATMERVAAAFASMGSTPLPSRDSLRLELAPDQAARKAQREALTALPWLAANARRNDTWRDPVITAILEGCGPDGEQLDRASQCIATCIGVRDIRVRDTVLWEMATWPSERIGPWAEIAREAVRGSMPKHRASIATVAAVAAWLTGDGARALCAVDVAHRADPDYSLNLLIGQSLGIGMHPDEWRACMAGMTRSTVRRPTTRT